MRALRDRPTALERWPSGVREGMQLATGRADRDADAFYQKRVPEGRSRLPRVGRDHLPVRPDRRGDLPDRDRGAGVVRAHGHAHLPPLAGPPHRRRPPRRAAHRPRPAAGHDVRRRHAGRRRRARSCSRSSGWSASPKTSGNRGIHIYVRIEPRWEFTDVRHAAIGFGRELARRDDGVTMDWWKEERGERIFVDFNQNSRDRTIASAYSLRPKPGAPGLDADDVGRARRGQRPARLQPLHRARPASPTATRGPPSTTRRTPSSRCSTLYDELPGGEMPFPPDYPKMPGEPPRVQPSKKVESHWDAEGNRIGRLTSTRPAASGPDALGDPDPVDVAGVVVAAVGTGAGVAGVAVELAADRPRLVVVDVARGLADPLVEDAVDVEPHLGGGPLTPDDVPLAVVGGDAGLDRGLGGRGLEQAADVATRLLELDLAAGGLGLPLLDDVAELVGRPHPELHDEPAGLRVQRVVRGVVGP